MREEINKIKLTKSEKYFVNDLYQIILSSASDPSLMMEKLSQTLREYIGAKEIVLFECNRIIEGEHRIISHIDIDEEYVDEYLALAKITHEKNEDIRYYGVEKQNAISESIRRIGYNNLTMIPIVSNKQRIGCLHVYETFQEEMEHQLIRLMSSVRPLIGVVLDNYQLFNKMELLLKERTNKLDLAHRELETLINTVPDLIIDTDDKLNINNIFNYECEKYYFSDIRKGDSFSKVITPNQLDIKKHYVQSLEDNGICVFTEKVIAEKKINYLENRIKRTGTHYLHIIRDITSNVLAEEKIEFMNQFDQLTGLYNRKMFYKFYSEIKTMDVKIGMLLLDMNGLKLLNETLGFAVGDRYLSTLAHTCERIAPRGSYIARVGDDEIGFIMANVSADEIKHVVGELYEKINELNKTIFEKFPLSVSTGYYVDYHGSKDYEQMFSMAEKNLNQDKLLNSESKKHSIVKMLTKALEARDFITEGHAYRLEELLDKFAVAMHFDAPRVNRLRLFGKFHDIGKVGIKDHILFKPGKLTEIEMNEMKKHSEIGYKIALTAADLHPVADFILKHHERFDGTGYPFGISREQIPIECRMLAIVDAFDAMTNDRPYRKALKEEIAVDELKKNMGTQFDPYLVNFFIEKVLYRTVGK